MKTTRSVLLVCVASLLLIGRASAADHKVEKLAEPAPADSISAEIAGLLQPEGVKVIRGASRVVCEIWMCKEWPVASLEASGDVMYPFQPGQLIGVIRYPRKGKDFRDQDVAEGVYTLRYGHQPVDGAHVGTSPTRDFVLLVPASEDSSPEPIEYKALTQLSAKASGTNHPALLSLQRVAGDEPIRHQEEHDWWIVRLTGSTSSEGQSREQPLDLVVVGQAAA